MTLCHTSRILLHPGHNHCIARRASRTIIHLHSDPPARLLHGNPNLQVSPHLHGNMHIPTYPQAQHQFSCTAFTCTSTHISTVTPLLHGDTLAHSTARPSRVQRTSTAPNLLVDPFARQSSAQHSAAALMHSNSQMHIAIWRHLSLTHQPR